MPLPKGNRPIVLREMLRLLTGSEALSLAEMREALEESGHLTPSSGAKRQATERTLRNHLTLLRQGCQDALGTHHEWIQGSGEVAGIPGGGKGPYYRLRLRDAVPLIDAAGTVRNGTDADAMYLAAILLSVPGEGPFDRALSSMSAQILPDGSSGDGTACQPLDTVTRSSVVAEILRVLHRNGGQVLTRSRYRRWLRLFTDRGEQLVWPMILHPAWTPPCPGWRLLCWQEDGWHDLPLFTVEHAQAGPMLHEHPVELPPRMMINAACLHAAAFQGSCPGPIRKATIITPSQSLLHRMRWSSDQIVDPLPDGRHQVRCATSDSMALIAWARAASVEARLDA